MGLSSLRVVCPEARPDPSLVEAYRFLGKFVREELIPYSRTLAAEVPDCIPEQDRDRFLAFMRRMLRWLPEERPTAKELKDDP